MECYDPELASAATGIFAAKRDAARLVAAAELDGRSLPVRLWDGIARLASPYL